MRIQARLAGTLQLQFTRRRPTDQCHWPLLHPFRASVKFKKLYHEKIQDQEDIKGLKRKREEEEREAEEVEEVEEEAKRKREKAQVMASWSWNRGRRRLRMI